MNSRERGLWRECSIAIVLLIFTNNADSKETSVSLPTNHKLSINADETNFKPSVNNTLLKMEARIDVEDGMDLMQFESKEEIKKPLTLSLTKVEGVSPEKGVSYVTAISEPRISPTTSSPSGPSFKSKGQVFDDNKTQGNVFPVFPELRGLHTTKVYGKDSYLDALKHSHTSKDQNEGIVQSDVRPKVPKIFRRDYHEGPVYRPDSDRYGLPGKTPSSFYGNPEYESPGAPAPTQTPFFPTPSNSYSVPEHSYDDFGPPAEYGGPQASQGNPHPSYASPQPSYGAPQVSQSNYGPPSPSYGPPVQQIGYVPSNGYLPPQTPQQGYGPPLPAPTYGAPYALPGMPGLPSFPMIDFTWPFALKLNAFTLAKIILKLVIFKMIVKFIAVICLLLFIPKLEIVKKDEKQDDYDEGRGVTSPSGATDRLNFLTSMVMASIEKHDKNNGGPGSDCVSFPCRLRKALTSGESWSDYVRLFRSYTVEELQNVGERERTGDRTKVTF